MAPDNSKETDISRQEISILSSALNKSVDRVRRGRHMLCALIAGILLGAFITVVVIEFTKTQTDIRVSGVDALLHKTDETIREVKELRSGVNRLSDSIHALATHVRTKTLAPSEPKIANAVAPAASMENKDDTPRPPTVVTRRSCVAQAKKSDVDRGRFTVYIHYRGREHRRTVTELVRFLQKKEYMVPETERVKDMKNDIRYFHAADAKGALALQNDLEEFFREQPGAAKPDLDLLDLSRVYPQASHGALEIWINF